MFTAVLRICGPANHLSISTMAENTRVLLSATPPPSSSSSLHATTTLSSLSKTTERQWRRQDLLRGAQSWKMGHGALTAKFRAGCRSCLMTNSFVPNAVLIERAVSCWHLPLISWSQTTQYLDSWLSDLLQSKLKWNCWKSRGARAPVPHSWRRHCQAVRQ